MTEEFFEKVKNKLAAYLPNFFGHWNFSLFLKLEIGLILLTCIYLYFFRIQPYLILTSKTFRTEQEINREISNTLFQKYAEQLKGLEGWWQSHVPAADQLPKVLNALNPSPTSQMVGSLKVGETISKEGYKQVVIETMFQGDFPSLLTWLKHLDTLPFFVQVEKLDLKPNPKEELMKENLPSPQLLGEVTLTAILK